MLPIFMEKESADMQKLQESEVSTCSKSLTFGHTQSRTLEEKTNM